MVSLLMPFVIQFVVDHLYFDSGMVQVVVCHHLITWTF